MEECIDNIKPFIVMYYNRMVNETQIFRVMAKNEFRAGRLFYLKHGRKMKGTIESIQEISKNFWTEKQIREYLK